MSEVIKFCAVKHDLTESDLEFMQERIAKERNIKPKLGKRKRGCDGRMIPATWYHHNWKIKSKTKNGMLRPKYNRHYKCNNEGCVAEIWRYDNDILIPAKLWRESYFVIPRDDDRGEN